MFFSHFSCVSYNIERYQLNNDFRGSEVPVSLAIGHWRSDELGSGPNWKKIARFKKLQSSSIEFQNDLALLGRIGKASLSEFPEINALAIREGYVPEK